MYRSKKKSKSGITFIMEKSLLKGLMYQILSWDGGGSVEENGITEVTEFPIDLR